MYSIPVVSKHKFINITITHNIYIHIYVYMWDLMTELLERLSQEQEQRATLINIKKV